VDKSQLVRRWKPIGAETGGPVPSYQARGPEGQFAQVHQIFDETAESQRLLSLVRQVQSHPPPDLVEVLEMVGGLAVVTHILPAQVTLETWLTGHVPPEAPAGPRDAAPEESSPGMETGAEGQDYSAYFKVPTDEPGSQPAAPTAEPDEPGTTDVPMDGEGYTAMFRVPSQDPQSASADPPPASRPVSRPESAPPPPPAPPTPEAAPPEPPADGEGYTSLFQAAPAPPEPQRPSPEQEPPPKQPPPPAPKPPPTRAPESDSITDMFRRPEPPPRQPDLHRDEGWSQPQRDLSPLRITLDEYVRRLEPAGGGDSGFRRNSADGGIARAAPAPQGWDNRPDRGDVASSSPPTETRSARPARRSRELLLLIGILSVVAVVAVAIILFLLLRG